ncbi:MAG: putative signal transducing protein [Lentimonas sp.]
MIEVYSDLDFTKVGLYQGLLESAGIDTVLRNRNSVSMTTSVPIPSMYPNICVYTEADALKAQEVFEAYQKAAHDKGDQVDWTCEQCGEKNEGNFSECWSCQTDAP